MPGLLKTTTKTTTGAGLRRKGSVKDLRIAAVMWENLYTGPSAFESDSDDKDMFKKVAIQQRQRNTPDALNKSATEISSPYNVHPGPAPLHTAMNAVPILQSSSSSWSPDSFEDSEPLYAEPPPRLGRPLSTVKEEGDFSSSPGSYNSDCSAFTSPNLFTPYPSDEQLTCTQARVQVEEIHSSPDSSVITPSSYYLPSEDPSSPNALQLVWDSSRDDDERIAEMQLGFGTLGNDDVSPPKKVLPPPVPPRNPLRSRRSQIKAFACTPPEGPTPELDETPPSPISQRLASLPSRPPRSPERQRTQPTPLPSSSDRTITASSSTSSFQTQARLRRGDPLPPLFIYGHLATAPLLSLLKSQSQPRDTFSVQPARLVEDDGHYHLKTISKCNWPVIVSGKSKCRNEGMPVDGVLVHGLSTADRRRFKSLHPQYQNVNVSPTDEKAKDAFVPLFTRTLVRATTTTTGAKDGESEVVDAVAFVWREDASARTGLELI